MYCHIYLSIISYALFFRIFAGSMRELQAVPDTVLHRYDTVELDLTQGIPRPGRFDNQYTRRVFSKICCKQNPEQLASFYPSALCLFRVNPHNLFSNVQ